MRFAITFYILILFSTSAQAQMIDENTPEDALPNNSNITGNWELHFSDEFNDTQVNTIKWNVDSSTKSRAARPSIGIQDWRWKPSNVMLKDGNLVLEVHKTGNNSMTNGSIQTYTKYHTQYGYFEARIKVGEADKGTHTAFWLQGPNMGNVDGTANDGAEIDIFETAWTGDYTKSVVHIDGYGADHQANTKRYETPGIHNGFHIWGFHWTEYFMDIYYDGVFKVRYSNDKWVVRSPEFLWLSNGASFGLTGDEYFIDYPIGYLTETQVDYIRVWKTEGDSENDSTLCQDNWSLISTDSEDLHAENLATEAFDGNPYSFWHTEWYDSQPGHPHELQIDLGDTAKIFGLRYLPRQDASKNGNILQYRFFASMDSENWGNAISAGTFSEDALAKDVRFEDSITCRYVKFVSLSSFNDLNFANTAELNLFGSYTVLNASISPEHRFQEKLKTFPNPFQNTLNIEIQGFTSNLNWKIFSVTGTLIKAGTFKDFTNIQKINTEDLNAGSYFLQLEQLEEKEVKLILKN